ncbi:catecholate siderophore receptor Fiu [Acidovorax sp.]|uniref:catecholate siderophore receptor Fiu n=1 Tax=Acidovorax sp. TaxID=1872122 RepID=UPI0026258FA4|nr:catecholate siderophore receptor Fiu [Acidovorax sp.]
MARATKSHPSFPPKLLALAIAALPGVVSVAAQAAEKSLPETTVSSDAAIPYKTERAANPKLTQPLVNTPQTISVINQDVIREQGGASLMDALRNTPGITMQLGENGNTSAGDTFMLRAFSTQTATFIDGIRDLGAITRDVFNVDQVEVVKGPAGADIGRGAASGYINLITKLPSRTDQYGLNTTWSTANHKRVTADLNKRLGETAAARLNVMGQAGGVQGRNVVENNGYAIAPSFAFGLGTPTRIYLYSQHVRQDNVPDGGIPTIGMPGFYNAAAQVNTGRQVNRENFYGSSGDYEKVDADMVSVKFEHDLGGGTVVRNIARAGTTKMDRSLTGVHNINAANLAQPNSWTVDRRRQRVDQANDVLANLTNLTSEFATGSVKHTVSAGLELMYERQKTLGFGTTAQTINGVAYPATVSPPANLYAPNPGDVLGLPYKTGADTDGNTSTAALYAFDTLQLNDQWQVSGGLRYEHYRTKTNAKTIVTTANAGSYPGYGAGALAPTDMGVSGNLASWKLGVLYKPAANGSIYAALGNSLTPPGGANFALSPTATNQNNAALDPQETRNIELGTKWELLNNRLNLTAAVFRTDNDKQVTYDSTTGLYTQHGKTRVQGIELAAVGQITNFWQVSAGIAKTQTRALGQASRDSAGVVTRSDSVRWSPDLTATAWTSYTWDAFTLGGGVRYVSDQKRVVTAGTNLGVQNMPKIPSFVVADLMAAYKVNRNVNLRLNLYNLFDKKYISTLNNSGARMVLGAPRSASLTAEVLF